MVRLSQNSTYSRLHSQNKKPVEYGSATYALNAQSLLLETLRLVRSASPGARTKWQELHLACQREGMSFPNLVGKSDSGMAAVEEVLEKGDWGSAIKLHRLLPDGDYAGGRVKRTDTGLNTMVGEQPNGAGLCIKSNGIYVGQFKAGVPEGKGTWGHSEGDSYVGEWYKGRWHGWGKLTGKHLYPHSAEGLFANGMYIGNPKDATTHKENALGQLKKWLRKYLTKDI